MTNSIDSKTLENANNVLALLMTKISNEDYNTALKNLLSDSEYEHNKKILLKTLKNIGRAYPVGVVPTGTGVVKDEAGLSGEEGQQAIQLLKQANRIQQCGRGRGKCLIILSTDGLVPDEEDEENISPDVNVPDMLRAVRDSFRHLQREVEQTTQLVKEQEKTIEVLNLKINQRDEKIEELQNHLNNKAITTWQ